MKLLLTADAVGGTWAYATDLAEALGRRGVETVLALLGPPASDKAREKAREIPGMTLVETDAALDWLAPDRATLMRSGRRVAELAADLACDVAQLNAPALLAGTRFAMPTVAVAHSSLGTWWATVKSGELPADFVWRDAMTREGLLTADRSVAPTASFSAALARVHRLPRPPATVHNGRRPLPVQHGAKQDFVLTAGRLWDEGKGAAILDTAAALVGVPVKAAGATVGPRDETIRFETIHALGQLDEAGLANCLAARPVFASAALYEPFGLAALEAALAGCPLVLSDIPTFREIWGDAATYVAPHDARGFSAGINNLILDASTRRRLGEAAAARASRYTTDAMADAMITHYRPIVTRRGRIAA